MSAMEDKIEEAEDVFRHDGIGKKPTTSSLSEDVPYFDMPSKNTGPKGVLNDYKIAKARMEQRWKERKEADLAKIERDTMIVSTLADDEKRQKSAQIEQMDDDELDKLVSDIDAQFEADYKALRIKEMELMDTRMKTGIAAKAPTGPSKIQGKTFGELYEITKEELVDFVEKEGPNVLIFIHVYQIQLRACIRLSEIMAMLSKMYPHIKWARMMEVDKRDFEDDTLPILVAYKNGDVLHSHIKLVDDIGHNFDLDDVITFLEENKYLKASEAVIDDE